MITEHNNDLDFESENPPAGCRAIAFGLIALAFGVFLLGAWKLIELIFLLWS